MSFLLREVQRPLRPGVTEEDLGKMLGLAVLVVAMLVGSGDGISLVGFVHDLGRCL